MNGGVTIFTSSVSSNREAKKQMQHVFLIMDGKGYAYDKVDIATSADDKQRMRDLCGDPQALPPRFFKGEKYLGGYEEFNEAVESGTLPQFLGL